MTNGLSPFAAMDIRTLIDAQMRRRGDNRFLTWEPFDAPPQHWSYASFFDRVRRFASGLQRRGLVPGDRLIVHMHNAPDQLVVWLGATYAGIVPVTTNAHSAPDELAYYAEHSGALAAVTQPDLLPAFAKTRGRIGWIAVTGTADFDAIDGEPADLAARPHVPDAPFGIQYTSGTTSRPKAVLWTHANALWGARLSAMHEDLRTDDVHLVNLPLFHTNAQVYSVLASLWVGATIVLQPKFSTSRFWDVSVRNGCTITSILPIIKTVMDQPVPAGNRYRLFGSPIADTPFDAHFGVKSVGWYGMTETITHPIVGSAYLPDMSMSIGRPSPSYRIHILDAAMRPVAPGEEGDLYIGGQPGLSLFAEYAGDPAATAAAFTDDGLFITGDRMRLDESGYIFFADRSKDMLKVSGENVSAAEVERVIVATGLVAEAAVVGRADEWKGQLPVAFVIAHATTPADAESRIVAACREQLAAFKVPVEIRRIDDFPRGLLNKVAKAELRRLLDVPA